MSFPLNSLLLRNIKEPEESSSKKLPMYIYAIGSLAGLLTSFAFLPQVIKNFKNKTPSSLTWITLFICIIGQSLWSTYGFLSKDAILIIFSSIALGLYILLFVSRLLF
jgi:MtN3 and saliva related transmembrane protein